MISRKEDKLNKETIQQYWSQYNQCEKSMRL